MKLNSKIHALKHYIRYAWNSKTKFKIHSPFVFKFITEVLEGSSKGYDNKAKDLIAYYRSSHEKINFALNAGAGSQEIQKELYRPIQLVDKLGIPAKYGKILYALASNPEIHQVLELGTSIGTSTSYMSAAGNKPIVSIDANPDVIASTKRAFDSFYTDHQVEFVQAYFDDVLNEKINGGLRNTLIFIDGDHNKDAVLRYFKRCLQHTEAPCIIVFDDIYWSEEMTEAWWSICAHPAVHLSIDLYRIGIVFFREETLTKEHFKLWY